MRARKPGPDSMRGLEALRISWRRLNAMDLSATPCAGAAWATMRVPGCSGLKVLSARTGMPLRIAGTKVCGWRTLPP